MLQGLAAQQAAKNSNYTVKIRSSAANRQDKYNRSYVTLVKCHKELIGAQKEATTLLGCV